MCKLKKSTERGIYVLATVAAAGGAEHTPFRALLSLVVLESTARKLLAAIATFGRKF